MGPLAAARVWKAARLVELACAMALSHAPLRSPSDLEESEPWAFLVALILSVRSRDSEVNRFMKAWGQPLRTKAAVLALGQEGLASLIRPFGLASKARLIWALASAGPVDEDWSSGLPDVPGLGPKLRAVHANVVRKLPEVGVDVHTHRLFERLAGIKLTYGRVHAVLNACLEARARAVAHILMVRVSKGSGWCGKGLECARCAEIGALLGARSARSS